MLMNTFVYRVWQIEYTTMRGEIIPGIKTNIYEYIYYMNEYNLHFNLSLSQLYDTWPWVWFSAVWCMYDACVICNVEK